MLPVSGMPIPSSSDSKVCMAEMPYSVPELGRWQFDWRANGFWAQCAVEAKSNSSF